MKFKSHSKDNWRQRYPGKRKRKSIFRNRFFWLFILVFIFLTGLFYFFVFSPVFQIKKVTVQGTVLTNSSEIEETVFKTAERRILFFSTKSIFLFDGKQTERLILERFFPIDNIIFQKKLPYHLAVKVEERKPRAVFCLLASDSLRDSQALKEIRKKNENCFWIDKQGIAFYRAGQALASQELASAQELLVFSETERIELGREVVKKEILEFTVWADYKLQGRAKIRTNEFIVSDDSVEARIDTGMAIYFDPKKDLNQQIEDLVLVMENEIFSQEEKGLNIEYVDLRFDKVFYK